jgi:hypothetical protein
MRRQICARHALGKLDAAHAWHVHVNQCDVRLGGADQTQPILGRTRFTANANVRLLQDHAETGANQLVIVHEYDVNHLAPPWKVLCLRKVGLSLTHCKPVSSRFATIFDITLKRTN